eukprot:9488027-Pyramimonas_sp.AAC.1
MAVGARARAARRAAGGRRAEAALGAPRAAGAAARHRGGAKRRSQAGPSPATSRPVSTRASICLDDITLDPP